MFNIKLDIKDILKSLKLNILVFQMKDKSKSVHKLHFRYFLNLGITKWQNLFISNNDCAYI